MLALTRRMRLTGLALVLVVAAVPATALAPADARSFVADVAERATTVLGSDRAQAEKRRELRAILRTAFDLDYIGRLVLGPTYRSLSPAQREAYDEAFKAFVLETYSRRINDYGGEQLEIIGAEQAGARDVKVQSRVVGVEQGGPVRIDWRVREREGGPRIIDVEIEGVSMAISQRSEFASVVDQRGIDGLIAMLEDRASPS